MKILQVTFNLSSGGGERFIVELSNELSQTNDVVLVQIQSNEDAHNAHYLPDLSKQIEYVNLGFNEGASWGVMTKLMRIIKQEKPDVVHAHCTLLPISLAALFYREPKYFHTLHSTAERCLGSSYLKPLYSLLYRKYVQAITISQTCNDSYDQLYHLNNAKVITNGRAPIIPTEAVEEVRKEVEALKLHSDDEVFIHVGRFHPVKNHTLLFETFKRVIDEGTHVILLVVGNGFEGHEVFNKDYCRGIYLLGEKRNVGDYLLNADCFVMSSIKEGLPISLLEAMSAGLIPVSTPAGGVCDVIVNHLNGYLSKTHEPEDFYNTVKEALENVAGVKPEEVKMEYQEKYSITECARKYKRLYLLVTQADKALGGGINTV